MFRATLDNVSDVDADLSFGDLTNCMIFSRRLIRMSVDLSSISIAVNNCSAFRKSDRLPLRSGRVLRRVRLC